MKNLCWLLIALAAIATVVGGVLHLAVRQFLAPAYGYWMAAVVLLLLAISIRLMDEKKP